MCNSPGCREQQLPLVLQPEETEFVELEFDAERVKKMLVRQEWEIMRNTVQKFDETLLEAVEATMIENEEFLRKVHRVIFELHINTGSLLCESCGRSYPIDNGIPNMLIIDQ